MQYFFCVWASINKTLIMNSWVAGCPVQMQGNKPFSDLEMHHSIVFVVHTFLADKTRYTLAVSKKY